MLLREPEEKLGGFEGVEKSLFKNITPAVGVLAAPRKVQESLRWCAV